ncbi:asparaginase [Lachnospiraceae bacterium JLR.KK009]|nr:L-asparaginase, type I [Lachnospiraceae bacterium A2]MCI8707125.1 asparaginase [Lachnospiraceae bacterium]
MKKNILLIATGGTIASKNSDHGLAPLIRAEEILSYIPDVYQICSPAAVQICNIDSTNMEPCHWKLLVDTIRSNYGDYDGFVVAHGTDTMAYTAAALSYMVQNSNKPIVITGAQKSIDLEITDAKSNLLDSFCYAADEKSQGVQIVFGGKVIAGTRAKKIRSKSYNAFDSIDFPFLAMIQDGRIMRYIPAVPYGEPVTFYEKMNDNIFLLKLVPGISPKGLRFLFEQYDAIIVESFGVGGIPASISDIFYELHGKYPEKLIILATQVAHEGSDMTVYEVGNRIKKDCRFLESYDMTLEAAIAKTMWVLGNVEREKEAMEQAFYKKINYDLIFDALLQAH